MWSRDYTQLGSRLLLLFGQLLVLIVCISYIQYIYIINIEPDKDAKDSFLQTDCFIIGKKLSTKGRVIHEYRSDFLLSYAVNGVQYTQWASGNGLDISYSRNLQEQEDYLSQFAVGGNYPCWYDPDSPQISIIVLRHNWLSTFPLMVPSVIGIITLYYFLKNLFGLLGYARLRAREVIDEKKEKAKKK